MCIAYIDELLCSGRTGGFAYDNQYYLSAEPMGFPFKDDPLYIYIGRTGGFAIKHDYTLVEPVGLPSLIKHHNRIERGVYHPR